MRIGRIGQERRKVMEIGRGKGTDTLQTDKVFTRKEYIERAAFIADQRHLYCDNCDRRRGVKDGKPTKRFVYAIGDAPCRACDIGDMLDTIEDYYPAADVRPVIHATWETDTCHFYCSECKQYVDYKTSFCPNCGARMDGDGDGV